MTTFIKYSGAGNDFLILDVLPSKELIQTLCNRREGVGADGVLFLEPPNTMRIFNADGSEGEMCGNGLRCFVRHFFDEGLFPSQGEVQTLAGTYGYLVKGESIKIDMLPPTDIHWSLPLGQIEAHFLNTGVPHLVLPNFDQDPFPLMKPSSFAPRGANVNLLKREGAGISIRTFERGVNGETHACGTGAVASALTAAHLYEIPSPLSVRVKSGAVLLVEFVKTKEIFSSVRLTGPAKRIFNGALVTNRI